MTLWPSRNVLTRRQVKQDPDEKPTVRGLVGVELSAVQGNHQHRVVVLDVVVGYLTEIVCTTVDVVDVRQRCWVARQGVANGACADCAMAHHARPVRRRVHGLDLRADREGLERAPWNVLAGGETERVVPRLLAYGTGLEVDKG